VVRKPFVRQLHEPRFANHRERLEAVHGRRAAAGAFGEAEGDQVINLLLHTFSQALQALVPAAAAFVWFRRHDPSLASAVRVGTIIALPLTLPATWVFSNSSARALDECILAIVAVAIGAALARMVWRGGSISERSGGSLARFTIAAICATVIVVRQTMEIGYVLQVAVVRVRSLDATVSIVAAVAAAVAVVGASMAIGRRLSEAALERATRTFAIVFLVQVVVYALHESAEARLLPWSEALHQASEPYGPDGVYGMHLSELLVLLPLVAALSERDTARKWIAAAVLMTWLVGGGASSFAYGPRAVDVTTDLSAALGRPHLLFRETGKTNSGLVSAVPLDALENGRVAGSLNCDRVSFAAGRGICLHGEPAFFGLFTGYTAIVLDRDLKARGRPIKLEGRPSRTRVGPGGRLGAITVFVVGDDYASASFSTRTTILDLESGAEIGDLEQFATWRNGERFSSRDFNFWGVTFGSDANTFYASLRTGGSTYLVRGDVGKRTMTMLRDNVECPSLSPDGRLIAFKKHVGPDPGAWRLAVLDVATMGERLVEAETRFVDDQVEWLDATHILYAITRRTTRISDVWVASVEGEGAARIYLAEAESPIVVR
jgi:hypothetical protein